MSKQQGGPRAALYRQAGKAPDVQESLEALANAIGDQPTVEPSVARVVDLILAAIAVRPGVRKVFVERAVRDIIALARDEGRPHPESCVCSRCDSTFLPALMKAADKEHGS